MYIKVEAMTRNSPAISKSSMPHDFHVFDELGGQPREVDLVNIDFLLFDQIKEQIQRTLKHLELDFVFGHESVYARANPTARRAALATIFNPASPAATPQMKETEAAVIKKGAGKGLLKYPS